MGGYGDIDHPAAVGDDWAKNTSLRSPSIRTYKIFEQHAHRTRYFLRYALRIIR